MFNSYIVVFSLSLLGFCYGLPTNSVSEAHSSASQKLHVYMKNSTSEENYQFSPILSQLRSTNEQIDYERYAVLPFLSFLFDTLGVIDDVIGECLDDLVIELIPDDPADPGYPTVPENTKENDTTPKNS
ncbi:unnamed protein product [Parnassius apollo]|uniref:(apollo) hypothetical protein n=1 Tax=Parnassius apollo TaxID=110799 RepID=A0A8S3XX62_PARAO|nr:unnamed protein product [Parnassius apollo]